MRIFAYIDPSWEHNRLVCNNELEYDDNLFEKLEAIAAYSLQFQINSESRWDKSCRSSCKLLRSIACGLDGLVSMPKADSNVSNDKLHGFDRCVPLARICFLVNAFGCQPAEGLNFELFEMTGSGDMPPN